MKQFIFNIIGKIKDEFTKNKILAIVKLSLLGTALTAAILFFIVNFGVSSLKVFNLAMTAIAGTSIGALFIINIIEAGKGK